MSNTRWSVRGYNKRNQIIQISVSTRVEADRILKSATQKGMITSAVIVQPLNEIPVYTWKEFQKEYVEHSMRQEMNNTALYTLQSLKEALCEIPVVCKCDVSHNGHCECKAVYTMKCLINHAVDNAIYKLQ